MKRLGNLPKVIQLEKDSKKYCGLDSVLFRYQLFYVG